MGVGETHASAKMPTTRAAELPAWDGGWLTPHPAPGHSGTCTSEPRPPCFAFRPLQGTAAKGIPGQEGEGQILGCKWAGELVVKNLSRGGGTTWEPTLQILSMCSFVVDRTYKTQVERYIY